MDCITYSCCFFFQDGEEEGSWKNRKNTSCASFPVMKVIQEEEKTLIKFLSQSFGWQKKMGKVDQNSVSKHNRLNNRSFGKGIEKMFSIMNT